MSGEEGIVCPNCKHENPVNAKFCMNCGMSLIEEPKKGAIIKLVEIKEDDRIILRFSLLVMTIVLLLDAILNKYVQITAGQISIFGIPYFISFVLTVLSLYIIIKKNMITSLEKTLLLSAVILGLFITLVLYVLPLLTTNIQMYSPLWIIYLLILPIVWRIFRS